MARSGLLRLRRRVYELLDQGIAGGPAARSVHIGLVLFIILNVLGAVLESVPSIGEPHAKLFHILEYFSAAVFGTEYFLRLWAAVEHAPLAGRPPWRARVKYALTPMMLVDLLAVMPFFLAIFMPADLRALTAFRLLRFFKLARYSPGMSSLLDAIYAERRALLACFVILSGAVLAAATAMHLAEHDVQPERFGSIPAAMWWAVVTLTTVGYGDVVPVTVLGRVIGGITMIAGLVMLALPVGIVASAFAREIHRRDFVVTWSMVAKVPLFSSLDAAEVADIMRYLKSQTAEPGEVICRRGEEAHSMYFIGAGTVEIELPDRKLQLDQGHFFGEMAALQQARRSATVRAVTRVKLLALDSHDLHLLMELQPAIAREITEMAQARLARDRMSRHGDMVPEELAGHGSTGAPG